MKVPRSDFIKELSLEKLPFELESSFTPRGDQPDAISQLKENITSDLRYQTLLGVTGSGKTFSIANVIADLGRPTLVIAPNKTLAAQLYSEFREFFPKNNVRYFVSYYDYYQPEAYVAATDTYIEKDASINDEIDKLRHASTRAVLESTDVIVVASVSCIYGLGAPEDYFQMMLFLEKDQEYTREDAIRQLVLMQYKRSDIEFTRGRFRVRGDTLDVFPADQDSLAYRITFFGDEIEELHLLDPLTGHVQEEVSRVTIYPVSHFVTDRSRIDKAIVTIKQELKEWLPRLRNQGKLFEAERLEQRTMYDLELLRETGFCPGVENYSRHIAGRDEGEPPTTLLDYFPEDFLLVIDESHVTLPQLGGMYRGDQARKKSLVDYGFRLPSALDNRPLSIEEFWERVGQTIFVSATPSERELDLSSGLVIEQVNRPTGLLDPQVIVRPALNQVDDLMEQVRLTIERGDRVLVTTLTKKMAEDLSEFFRENGVKCRYLHSDVKTIERVELLRGLRRGDFDVLIGINLLREGLDLVEVSLVAILDADKEGFLRSGPSLIQTIGRAARNVNGRAILYGDHVTKSMQEAIDETDRRRKIQAEYNSTHGITPESAKRKEQASLIEDEELTNEVPLGEEILDVPSDLASQKRLIAKLKKDMFDAASKREFERAAELRDAIGKLTEKIMKLS